jgi:hypothetical protein
MALLEVWTNTSGRDESAEIEVDRFAIVVVLILPFLNS